MHKHCIQTKHEFRLYIEQFQSYRYSNALLQSNVHQLEIFLKTKPIHHLKGTDFLLSLWHY